MINFILVGFKRTEASPIQVPFSNWIEAANDEIMYTKSKK